MISEHKRERERERKVREKASPLTPKDKSGRERECGY